MPLNSVEAITEKIRFKVASDFCCQRYSIGKTILEFKEIRSMGTMKRFRGEKGHYLH